MIEGFLTVVGSIAIGLLCIAFFIIVISDIQVTVSYEDYDEGLTYPIPALGLPAIRKGRVFYDELKVPYCAAMRDIYAGDMVQSADFHFYSGEPEIGNRIKSEELVELLNTVHSEKPD